MRRYLRELILVSFFASSVLCSAQLTNVTGDQAPPIPGAGHDYIHMLNETVNPGNGAVNIRIGVPVPQARGITVPFAFAYDSNAAIHAAGAPGVYQGPTMKFGWIGSASYLSQGGWSYSIPRLSNVVNVVTAGGGIQGPSVCFWFTDYMFSEASGETHALGLSPVDTPQSGAQCEGAIGLPSTNYLFGADAEVQSTTTMWNHNCGFCSGASQAIPPPVTIADMNGTVYHFSNAINQYNPIAYSANSGVHSSLADWIEDRNGNKATISDSGNGVLTIFDTAGRSAVTSTGFGSTGNTIAAAGLSSPYTLTWQSFSSSSTLPLPYSLSKYCSPCTGTGPNAITNSPEVTKITLPNQQSYQFQYDPVSTLLSKITYPNGGYVQYTWSPAPPYSDRLYFNVSGDTQWAYYSGFVVTKRVVSFDGVTSALEQDFSYQTTWTGCTPPPGSGSWCQRQTTAVTKDLVAGTSFAAVYTYQPFLLPYQPNDSSMPGSGSTPVESMVQYYATASTSGQPLRTVKKTYIDPHLPPSESVTLDSGQTAETDYTYTPLWPNGSVSSPECWFGQVGSPSSTNDCLHVLSDKYEYDYGSTGRGLLVRRTHFDYASLAATPIFPTAASILNRPSDVITYDGSGNKMAEIDYAYDGSSVTGVSPVLTGHDEANYSHTYTARGNVTRATALCLQQGCSTGARMFTYDETGQVLTAKDQNQNVTSYSYTDCYASGTGTDPGNTNAFVTKITNPLGQFESFCYGYSDGQVRSTTDANNQTTPYTYNDSLGRLTEADYPDGGQTKYAYNDTGATVTTSQLLNTSGTYITRVNSMDGVGHVIQTQLTSDPDGVATTTFRYDGLGRRRTASNPSSSSSQSTQGTTTDSYDALSRVTTVTKQDGSIVQTAYCGSSTLTTDETGHWRRTTSDALGRLIEADEPNSPSASVTACPQPGDPVMATSYGYDALGNLLSVLQSGSRQRTFTYDSLSRLTSSINPESNTVPNSSPTVTVATTYAYDANGNLLSKTAPAQNQQGSATVTLSHCYDPLNRLTSKAYALQSCPQTSSIATYKYDETACLGQQHCYNAGRRTSMIDAAGSEGWSYDQMGRVLTDQRTTNSITKSTVYLYLPYVNGSINMLTYPSGRVLTYATGAAGRLQSAVDATNSVNYATAAHYTPQGVLTALTNGANLSSTYIYNNRLQPCWIYATTGTALPWQGTQTLCTSSASAGNVLDLKYGFNLGTGDNGNPAGITNNRDASRSQTFAYDYLNRVSAGQTSSTASTSPANCWGQLFGYDVWANLLSIAGASSAYTGCTQGILSVSVNAQNQIIGDTYDTAGNLTGSAGATYAYNAENQLTAAGGVTYLYDGDGQRVEKQSTKIYWYGKDGEVLDETDATGSTSNSNFSEYIFFGGQRIAHRDSPGNTFYYFADHLGTSRVIAEVPFGSNTATICYDADFYPFGGEHTPVTNTCSQAYKFTGKERDNESGLDYFIARQYGSSMGRFSSPDEPFVDQAESTPQSWNLYTYVRNNPVTNTDPTGNGCVDGKTEDSAPGESCEQVAENNKRAKPNVEVAATPPELDVLGEAYRRGGAITRPRFWAASAGMSAGLGGLGAGGVAVYEALSGYTLGTLTTLGVAGGSLAPTLYKTGDIIQELAQTPQGAVKIVGEAVVQGTKLIVKDISVFSAETGARLNVGAANMRAALGPIFERLKIAGFTQVQILGERTTGINPGRAVNITITLR